MTTQTTADTDIAAVRAGFEALARGDLAAFTDGFHPDATWNHRNEDRFGGVHHGSDGIVAFVTESMQLTAGTLRPLPTNFLADGQGRVSVLVHITASRPDGRSFDDRQVLVFTLDGERVRSVDQYVGEPRAVSAFWD
ncbi:MAG TPA: nuclear transport factor 2 family protein [Rugosimonospora sp.]|nr:nuclear transport factor 2 family protein [Rugosimonospora sp.]